MKKKKYYVIFADESAGEEIEAENRKEAQLQAEEIAEDKSNDNEHYRVAGISLMEE